MSSARDQIIQTTCELLEAQGYYATGLNQITQESGSPKGSLYHYFPDGKEGLAAEAIKRTGRIVMERIRQDLAAHEDAGEAVRQFMLTIAKHMEASNFRVGGPITTVALETASTNPRLRAVCDEIYQQWQHAFAEKLVDCGCTEDRATQLGTLIVSTIEGAIVLSRTSHSVEPWRQVADEIGRLLTIACAENRAIDH